ncbi:MAG: hypothetical protein LBT77_01740 [Mycoplasmataceae bacterium]|nr:hypothetical protein [Mycoplasmataceae bacterium]
MSLIHIVYLIVAIVFAIATIGMGFVCYWTMRNKPDPNRLESMDWFSKWIVGNRMLLCMMLTVILLLTTIALTAAALGWDFQFNQPD